MNRNLHGLIATVVLAILIIFVVPVHAQDEVTERSEMIKTQNALRIFREFEYDSRHLYFIMSTAIISFEGVRKDATSGKLFFKGETDRGKIVPFKAKFDKVKIKE